MPTVGLESWLWAAISLVLAVLYANLAWFFRQPRPGALGELAARLANWRSSPTLFQFLRLLYYVGIPFAALLWGHDAVIGRLLGLQRFEWPAELKTGSTPLASNWIDWAQDAGWAAVLGIGTWTLLLLGWWAYRRALVTTGEAIDIPYTQRSGWTALREAVYHEVHWAFYRNAPILTLGTYWGASFGLALAALEAVLNPAWRTGLTKPQQVQQQLTRGALAVISTVLFLLTENLWLALILHWSVSWGLGKCVTSRTTPRQSTAPTSLQQ
jgi:hypothetical protein